jgi:hypothetical protein
MTPVARQVMPMVNILKTWAPLLKMYVPYVTEYAAARTTLTRLKVRPALSAH